MGTVWSKLSCHKDVKEMIMIQCKESFLKANPNMKGINITENFMLFKIAEFYLKN